MHLESIERGLSMANLIVGAALLGAAALAIRYIWKSHKSEKNCNSCLGDCSNCHGCD